MILNPYRFAAGGGGNGLLTGLLPYYKTDESSAGSSQVDRLDANDSYDLDDSVSTCPSGTGIINNGATIDSSGLKNSIAGADPMDLADSFSVSLWYNRTATTNDAAGQGLVSMWTNANNKFAVTVRSGVVKFYIDNAGTYVLNGATSYGTSGFRHVVCVWDNGVGTYIYLDGSEDASDESTPPNGIDTGAETLQVGAWLTRRAYGILDEVGIWNRVLSPADVTALYNSGSGLPYSSFTA